jgi:hypothetical protein
LQLFVAQKKEEQELCRPDLVIGLGVLSLIAVVCVFDWWSIQEA